MGKDTITDTGAEKNGSKPFCDAACSARLPEMADGTPIGLGSKVWVAMEDFNEWPYTRPIQITVDAISAGNSIPDYYKGPDTIMGDDWEGGSHDCYQTCDEVKGVEDWHDMQNTQVSHDAKRRCDH